MATQQTYTPKYGLPNGYLDKQDSLSTPIKAEDLNAASNTIEAQMGAALQFLGNGVSAAFGDKLLVSAGTGLSINVASGIAVVAATGVPISVYESGGHPITVEANHNDSNPLYIYILADDGANSGNVSTRTGVPDYRVTTQSPVTGAVLLATVTTSDSAVLSVVANPDRFIKMGATGTMHTVKDGNGDAVDPAQPLTFANMAADGNSLSNVLFFNSKDEATVALPDLPVGLRVAYPRVDASPASRAISESTTMIDTDRDLTLMSDTDETITCLQPSQFMLDSDYSFTQQGAGTLTVSVTIYNAGGALSSITLNDGQTLTLKRYPALGNVPTGLKVKSLVG